MSTLFLSAMLACAPQPTALAVDGEASVTLHELGKVALPKIKVLDAKGQPITPAPEGMVFSVEPANVAMIEGTEVVATGDGTATVTAKLGELTTTSVVVVSLPDTVEVAGVPAPLPAVGGTFTVTANVLADGTKLEGKKVSFSSSDNLIMTVDAAGMVTLVAPGTANLVATFEELHTEVPVVVAPVDPAAAVPAQL